jgi:hypothetical protein
MGIRAYRFIGRNLRQLAVLVMRKDGLVDAADNTIPGYPMIEFVTQGQTRR